MRVLGVFLVLLVSLCLLAACEGFWSGMSKENQERMARLEKEWDVASEKLKDAEEKVAALLKDPDAAPEVIASFKSDVRFWRDKYDMLRKDIDDIRKESKGWGLKEWIGWILGTGATYLATRKGRQLFADNILNRANEPDARLIAATEKAVRKLGIQPGPSGGTPT